MRKRTRVLVVYKKDAYRQYIQEQRDPRMLRLLRLRHPDALDLSRRHVIHEEALDSVIHTLRQLHVDFDIAYRPNLKVSKQYDLVVSVGGDGTFLEAARCVNRAPLLGVNSVPSHSEAVFCAAQPGTFPRLIRHALAGTLPVLKLYRLKLSLNSRAVSQRALNDVLVVHDDPATMSRYRLRIGTREEVQKSSGLWVASAAGSSSAVKAAGGRKLPWSARRFQYRPRELYEGRLSRYHLRGRVLMPSERIRLTWLMRRGSAYLDGPHVKVPLRFADRIEISLDMQSPIRVLGLSRTRRSASIA